jgi:hypothetical protein
VEPERDRARPCSIERGLAVVRSIRLVSGVMATGGVHAQLTSRARRQPSALQTSDLFEAGYGHSCDYRG